MRVSSRADYGVRALFELALRTGQGPIHSKEIAARQDIPEAYLHQVLSAVISANGNITVRSHFQPQAISGVGLTTGDKYQATGVTEFSGTLAAPFPVTSTFVNNFRFIGTGAGNKLLIHEVAHLTIDANGVVRVEVDSFSEECR